MNISFDIFNEHPELQKGLSSDEHIFYTSYLKFFADKLSHLKNEIDYEESQQDDRFIIIHVLYLDKGPCSFLNYSNGLKDKMVASFTKDDFDKFGSDLNDNQQRFHN